MKDAMDLYKKGYNEGYKDALRVMTTSTKNFISRLECDLVETMQVATKEKK